MDWDKLRIFHAAAEAGSFTHAGDVLGLSQSAVSRQVSALEHDLQVPLFHRHARGLILTEQGEQLFRTVQELAQKLDATRSRMSDSREKPTGELRITTTVGIGTNWLSPRLGEFLELYPDIKLNVILDDDELDLSMREADLAIHQISEILAVPGAKLIGPLPADIQNYTVYRGARSAKSTQAQAAEAFIAAMSSPDAAAILKDKGMERPN